MALPLLLIIPTLAVTGGTGVVSITQALSTNHTSNEINRTAQHTFEVSKKRSVFQCNDRLGKLFLWLVWRFDRRLVDLFPESALELSQDGTEHSPTKSAALWLAILTAPWLLAIPTEFLYNNLLG